MSVKGNEEELSIWLQKEEIEKKAVEENNRASQWRAATRLFFYFGSLGGMLAFFMSQASTEASSITQQDFLD